MIASSSVHLLFPLADGIYLSLISQGLQRSSEQDFPTALLISQRAKQDDAHGKNQEEPGQGKIHQELRSRKHFRHLRQCGQIKIDRKWHEHLHISDECHHACRLDILLFHEILLFSDAANAMNKKAG